MKAWAALGWIVLALLGVSVLALAACMLGILITGTAAYPS